MIMENHQIHGMVPALKSWHILRCQELDIMYDNVWSHQTCRENPKKCELHEVQTSGNIIQLTGAKMQHNTTFDNTGFRHHGDDQRMFDVLALTGREKQTTDDWQFQTTLVGYWLWLLLGLVRWIHYSLVHFDVTTVAWNCLPKMRCRQGSKSARKDDIPGFFRSHILRKGPAVMNPKVSLTLVVVG